MSRTRARGKRYDGGERLNIKKVIAVVIAIVVIIMFVFGIIEILKQKPATSEKTFVTEYYSIYEQNKWGIIDTKGNVIIEPQYDEMLIVPENSKPIFIYMKDVDYTNGIYTSKAINEKNEEIYTDYEQIEVIYNHDKDNNLWYESNILKVKKDGKYGLINLDGKKLVECLYDNIEEIVGTKGVYITTKDSKKGIVDNIGNIIIENKYTEITSLTNKYENGFIVKDENGKFGVVNYDKTTAIECKYDEIKNVYGNGMYVVREANILKVINTEGQSFAENKFAEVKSINSDNLVIKANGKYGVINTASVEKIPTIYDELTYMFSDLYIAKKDNKYGIININNEEKLAFNYTYITYLEEADIIRAETETMQTELLNRNFESKVTGLITQINDSKNYIRIRVGDEYKYYNFKLEEKANTEILSTNTIFLSKKDGKYGYVNDKGIVVVDYIYDDATEQNKYGYVAVNKDGKWGCLNQKGEIVVEPKFTLANNFVIDFIGNWHLAQDINANYYTK